MNKQDNKELRKINNDVTLIEQSKKILSAAEKITGKSLADYEPKWFKVLVGWADKAGITEERFPRNMKQLKSMKSLDIYTSKHKIEPIPYQIKYLTNLESISISAYLTSNIESVLSLPIKNLKLGTMGLDYSNFTIFLSRLPQLVTLSVYDEVDEVIDDNFDIENFPLLTRISLETPTGSWVNMLSRLDSLVSVEITLEEELPKEIFSLHNIDTLLISNGPDIFPVEILRLDKLRRLSIINPDIKDISAVFSSKKLTHLCLDCGLGFEKIPKIPFFFQGMNNLTSLTHLFLCGSDYTVGMPDGSRCYPSFTNFPLEILSLPNLKYLAVGEGLFETLPTELKCLRKIYLLDSSLKNKTKIPNELTAITANADENQILYDWFDYIGPMSPFWNDAKAE